MKQLTIILLAVVLVLSFVESCTKEEEELNEAPTCKITSPSENAVIQIGSTVNITVTANDPDGSISSLKISIDGTEAKTFNLSPYSYEWNTSGVASGNHQISALATDDEGSSVTSEVSIELKANAPVVKTSDVTEITSTTANSGGEITDDGGGEITVRGVVWSDEPGVTLDKNDGFTEDGTGKGVFTSTITGLSVGTSYFVKAYATNSEGTSYGEEKSFKTLGLPLVVTNPVSDITYESATFHGEVSENEGGSVLARGFVWNYHGDAEPTLDDNLGSIEEGSGAGSFSSNISSLNYDTYYQWRAYATNLGGTAYGDDRVFVTLPAPPLISKVDVSEIMPYYAKAKAEVINKRGARNVSIDILVSTSAEPDNNNDLNKASRVYADGTIFEFYLSNLDPETEYYVRAWGSNQHDETLGEISTFATPPFTIETGSFTDSRDNTTYSTIKIGNQIWMAENLAYLPEVCDVDKECGYWVYDYSGTDVAAAKATSNYSDYGVLYSQVTAKEVCPAGWHLPSSDEWSLLEINIGMGYKYAYGGSNRKNTTEGDKLKEVGNTHWTATYPAPNSGTNETGFTALPGGAREIAPEIKFQGKEYNAYFWTSTVDGNTELVSHYRTIWDALINNWEWSKDPYEKMGMSVRCVKD